MSYHQVLAVAALFFTTFSIVSSADLPAFIHVCHRHDPHIEECLIASVEDLRPYLVKGVPEYNIPSIEPLVMHDLMKEEAAGLKMTVYNVSAYGCSDFFVRKIEYNKDTMTFVLHVDIPKLRIEAHYAVDGKLLLIPVKGDGNMEANVTDCVSQTTLQGELYEKNGATYMHFVKNNLKVVVGGGVVRLENLFNGDKVLLGMINDVVNKNLDMFLKELMPVIEKSLSATFLEIGNDIVESFTYDQLFPQ